MNFPTISERYPLNIRKKLFAAFISLLFLVSILTQFVFAQTNLITTKKNETDKIGNEASFEITGISAKQKADKHGELLPIALGLSIKNSPFRHSFNRHDDDRGLQAELYLPNQVKPDKPAIVGKAAFMGIINGRIRSFDDIEIAGFPEFDDKFYQLYVGQVVETRGKARSIALISKEPVFYGRHVLVSCYGHCMLSSVYFPDTPNNQKPVVFIRKVLFEGYEPTECRGNQAVLNCDLGTEKFKKGLELFSQLETMLRMNQEFPTVLKNSLQ